MLPTVNYKPIVLKSPYTDKTISFRPITVGDVRLETDVEHNKIEIIRYICEILHLCCLDDKSIIEELYYFEVVWFYLRLKSESMDSEVSVIAQCKEHKLNYNTVVDLKDIQLPKFEKNKFDKKITINSKITLLIEYLKYKHIKNITEENDKLLNFNLLKGHIEDNVYTDYNDSNDYITLEDRKAFIESLAYKDVKDFNNFIIDTPFPYLHYENKCVSCINEGKKEAKEKEVEYKPKMNLLTDITDFFI